MGMVGHAYNLWQRRQARRLWTPLSKAAAECGRERAARYKGRPEGPREKQEAHKPG